MKYFLLSSFFLASLSACTTNTENSEEFLVGEIEVSDEQDFEAVSGRETIESDAERIAENRSNYVIIQPGALPTRSGSNEPNIVAYALATNNPVGQPLYARGRRASQDRMLRNCSEYASSDIAQIDFLKRGGPHNDRRGLDPDGDGFACGWDPEPFRG